MDVQDLYEALEKHYGSKKETLDELKSFSEQINNYPFSTASDIEDLIIEEARENNMCPDCFNLLDKRVILNEVVEYQGCEVQEEVREDYCNNCGWSSEE